MDITYKHQLRTDINILIPVCCEAAKKAHKIAIEEAKKYPDRFQEIYVVIYNHEFNRLYSNILKQFG